MKFWIRKPHRRKTRRTAWQNVLEQLETRALLAAPVVTPIADKMVTLGMGTTQSAMATDADGDEIYLSAEPANGGVFPPWLSFMWTGAPGDGTGDFTITNMAVGSVDVKVTATDENGETGTDTFTIIVSDGSLTVTSPVADQTVGVHTPFTLSVASVFTDTPSTGALTLSATQDDGTTLPAWLTFDPTTSTFSGTPLDADVGVTNVKLTAVDSTGTAAIDLFSIFIPLNHTPEFIKGADQTPTFDPFPQSYTDTDWATGILEGPPEEYDQTLSFEITTDNDALFSVLPQITIDADSTRAADGTLKGTLTYSIAGGVTGTANVTVKLKDNGGTASGGVDTSDAQMFVIAVVTSNDPLVTVNPPIPNQTVGVHTPFSLDVVDVFDGSNDNLTLTATLASGAQLPTWLTFTPDAPAVSPTGTFSGIPLDADIGSIDVMLTATDPNGFVTTDTFTITVPFNQTPQFDKGPDQTVDEDSGTTTVGGWATNILAGPPVEDEQVVDFIVTTDNDALFSTLPAISPTGTLTFTPAANANGTVTVTVQVHDNGGSASGGSDTSDPQTFTITINSINDAPSFTRGPNQTVLEDAAPQTVAGWATSINPGPNEASQSVTFTAMNDNNALFSVQPSVAADGTLTYTVAPNANGSATVTVTLMDDGGTLSGGVDTSASQTFTITVTPVNDAPSFALTSNSLSINEDAGVQSEAGFANTIVLGPANESSQIVTKFTVTQIASTGGLTFLTAPSIDPVTGDLTYQTSSNSNGTATFSVTMTDDGGTANGGVDTSVTQTFVISVTGVNDAPTISAPGSQTVLEDTSVAISGLSFGDVDAGPSDVIVTLAVADGTLTVSTNVAGGLTAGQVSGNGTASVTITAPLTALNTTLANATGLSYLPDADFNGSDSVDVDIDDDGNTGTGGAMTASATIPITITPVNDAPSFTLSDTLLTVDEDAPLQTVANFATSSVGPANESSQLVTNFTVTQIASTGNLTFLTAPSIDPTNGTLTFQPTAQTNGTATFSVTMTDDGGTANGGVDTSVTQTFIISVTSVNDPPSFTIVENPPASNEDAGLQSVPAFATNISPGPDDEAGQALTFILTPTGTTGGLTFLTAPSIDPTTGTLTYRAAADSNGTATFDVTLMDDGGGSDTSAAQTITITVNAVADIVADSVTTNEDTPITANVITGTNGASADNFEGAAALTSVTQGANGTVTFMADGTVTYTPNADFNGTDSFTYTVTSGGSTETATVTVTVNAVTDIVADSLTTTEDLAVTANVITGTNGASADNFEGVPVLTSVTQGANGTVSFTAAGSVTYTPNADFNGTDSFTYTVTSGGVTETGTVTVTISAVVDIVADSLTTNEDTPITANVITGTNGASADNFEGTPAITSVTQGTNGTVTFTAAGAVTYTPNGDFNGADSFTYTVTSGGVTETATVTITVNAVADIVDDALTTNEDTAVTANVITGTNGATADTFEGTPVLTSVTQGADGTVTFLADGTVTYTPDADFNGTDSFTYTVTSGGVTETATVTVTVTPINDAPTFTINPDVDIANPKVLLTAGPQSIPDWATVSTGADDEDQELTFLVTTDNPGLFRVLPRILVQPDGTATLTFTPLAGFGGTANITIRLMDDGGTANGGIDTSDAQTITITTFLADVTYTAVGSKKMKVTVVNGLLNVQTGGITNAQYLPSLIETFTFNGGSSDDLINLSGLDPTLYPSLRSIVINGGKGKDAITFNSISTDAFENFETLTINGDAGNDLINLTDLPTSLLPNIDTLMLNGGAGKDTIFGSDLDDAITGGAGNDSINGHEGTDRLVETANANFKLTDAKLTGVGTDTLANIEEAELTGGAGKNKLDASEFTGDVTLSGGGGNDTLLGGGGDDSLDGGDGNDTLIGGLGDDTLLGGAGNDLLIGGFGDDSLDGEADTDTGLGGQGAAGAPRFGAGAADAGDVLASLETINEAFATLFAFE